MNATRVLEGRREGELLPGSRFVGPEELPMEEYR